ncbi:glycosyltransferase family 2 protein [Sphingobacterium endophyticum]|uniref:glycosyltransferase family 2 protein n=1 Tax=Sphingobacterium endophyticum TaxID=2546448 RepID=UPI0012E2A78C|nr:glycosyltransferase family 2 protein [Sphingobacterium endophyticum]
MIFTIFTPAYNRANTLTQLYNSLKVQTINDFEWVVVDDGSTDKTEEIVNSFIIEGVLNIKYIKQNNGGKHRAINKGLDVAKGELFFIVDSDDYLLPNSLEIILKYYSDIKGDAAYIGVTGFRGFENGQVIGGKFFPNQITDSNLIERREKYKVTADLAHVLKTELFRKFYFPDINGEKFVAESIVWNRMSIEYKMRYFNEIIYIGEYLEGGLSSNSIKNRQKNSQYSTLLYKELVYNPNTKLRLKIKSLINYWRFAFCRPTSLENKFSFIEVNFLSIITMPIGYLYYLKDCWNNTIKVQKINNER